MTKEGSSPDFALHSTLLGHAKSFSCVKFSPDGRLLASSSGDKTILIWDVETGKAVQTLREHKRAVNEVSWSPCSRRVCSASDDRTARIFDVGGNSSREYKGHKNLVFCVSLNCCGNILATGSFDETVQLTDVRGGKVLRTIPGHNDPVTAIDFAPDGRRLVSASFDGLVRVWDADTGRLMRNIKSDPPYPITFAAFTRNARYILTSGSDGTIRLREERSRRTVKSYTGHIFRGRCTFSAVLLTSHGNMIVTPSEDNHVYMWDLQSEKVVQMLAGHTCPVIAVAAHPKRPLIASGAIAPDKSVKLWSAQS